MTRTMEQKSHCPTHCKYEDKLPEIMRTWSIHQTALSGKCSTPWWSQAQIRSGSTQAQLWCVRSTETSIWHNREPFTKFIRVPCVVGLDSVFFLKHQRKTQPTCNVLQVLVHWVAACFSPSGPVGRDLEAPHPCRWSARSLCTGIFAEKVETTEHDPKWHPRRHHGGMVRKNVQARIGQKTTTRWHKTAQKHKHGRILKRTAMLWTKPRRQKSMTVDTVPTSVLSAEPLHRWRKPFWNAESNMQENWHRNGRWLWDALPSKQAWPWTAGNEPCTMQQNITKVNYMLDNPFGSGDVERMQPRNQPMLFGIQLLSQATRWPPFG